VLAKIKVCAYITLTGLLLFGPTFAVLAQQPLSFTKSFIPSTIGPGSTSTLIFDIYNGDAVDPVQNMAFTDNLPAGVVIATPASATSNCGGILTAPDGGTTISLSGGDRLGPYSGCTIAVNVTSSITGTHTNTSGDLTSSVGNSGPAIADLIVDANRPGFSKSFSPGDLSRVYRQPAGRRGHRHPCQCFDHLRRRAHRHLRNKPHLSFQWLRRGAFELYHHRRCDRL
jgi:hypothetical protein